MVSTGGLLLNIPMRLCEFETALCEAATPLTRQEFEAGVVDDFKRNEAEDSPWRGPVIIHHGTDSHTAQQIYAAGHFHSGEDWPSFFTRNRAEAEDYARIRAKQAQQRHPDAKPVVITLSAPPYAVTRNSGSGEIETIPSLPLYFRGRDAYLRDQDIAAAVARWNKGEPRFDYEAYLANFSEGGEAASEMEKHRQRLDMIVPRIGPDMKPDGEAKMGDLGFFELLRTHQWLKRKRTPQYRDMRDAVYARGMQLQRERAS